METSFAGAFVSDIYVYKWELNYVFPSLRTIYFAVTGCRVVYSLFGLVGYLHNLDFAIYINSVENYPPTAVYVVIRRLS